MKPELKDLTNRVEYQMASSSDEKLIKLLEQVIEHIKNLDSITNDLGDVLKIVLAYHENCMCSLDDRKCKPCGDYANFIISKYLKDPNLQSALERMIQEA